jgi:elongation factor G
LPWGEKAEFKGVLDLLTMKAYEGDGKIVKDIPDEFKQDIETARMELIEAAAEGEDALLEKYLEGTDLSAEEIQRGLVDIVRSGAYIPVFVMASSAEIGLARLLDAMVDLMPSPLQAPAVIALGKNGEETLNFSDSGPLAAYVWKTTADPFVGKITYFRVYSGVFTSDTRVWNTKKFNEERIGNVHVLRGKETLPVKVVHSGDIATVPKLSATSTGDTLCDKGHPLTLPVPTYPHALFRVAVMPKTQADAAKISPTLTRLCEEDMTLSWYQEASTNQTILQGMGDQHIDVAIRKAEAKFQSGLLTQEPRVAYQESITKPGAAMYRHKKQTGGAGQFAEVWMRIEPRPRGSGVEFTQSLSGQNVDRVFVPSVEKGVNAACVEGILAGYRVTDLKIDFYDGKQHPVDSKDIAFQIAGKEGFKEAFFAARPCLLEPIHLVEVKVPDDGMGNVIGDLSSRRGKILGMDTAGGFQIIKAVVPAMELYQYSTVLRSLTGGRAAHTEEFDHYEEMPKELEQKVIAESKKAKEEQP